MPSLRGGFERAASAAQGQRFIAVVNPPGKAPTAGMFESSRGPAGWEPYAPSAVADDPIVPAMQRLADTVRTELAQGGKLAPQTLRALWVFDVAVVVTGDGANTVVPSVSETDAAIGAAPDVPALRVRKAAPVWMLLNEGPAGDPADAVAFAHGLRFGDADFIDYEDHPSWGGDLTIRAEKEAEYLLTWPAAGARVTIDGEPAEFRAASVPLIVVKVPAGSHRISVRYGDENRGRALIAIAAVVAAVLSFVALWLGMRPHP